MNIKPNLDLKTTEALLNQAGYQLPSEDIFLAVDPEKGSAKWVQCIIDNLCRLSSKDALTDLDNRRQFEISISREFERVKRDFSSGRINALHSGAVVLIIDIDHFKKINDTYGHPVGDKVIKAVAKVLQACVRPMDTVARIGGEEFAIILPNCHNSFNGRKLAERIRHEVENQVINVDSAVNVTITVSIGGSIGNCSSVNEWISTADEQLYKAKQEGRNRVCFNDY